jgi:hypothetical protein
MTCQLVITGWYSTTEPLKYQSFGDPFIRGREFRPLWWKSLSAGLHPNNVLIVDSASPVKPSDAECATEKFICLPLLINPGHSQTCTTHYSGYMASVILGLEYALCNDVDYVVYVEQDALLFGDIRAKIEAALCRSDIVFGAAGKIGEIQQSLFALNKKAIRKFLKRLHDISLSDKQLSPEVKFLVASSPMALPLLQRLASWDNPFSVRRPSTILLTQLLGRMGQYSELPFGYGRQRPINFSDGIFYFQQGSNDEVIRYKEITGF